MALPRPPVANAFAQNVAGSPSTLWDVPATYDDGWKAPGGVPVIPDLSDFNWLMWFCTLGVRYALSRGISAWDATETQYTVGSVVYRPIGQLFMLMGTATTGTTPETDVPNWYPMNVLDRGRYIDYATPAAAWKNYLGQVRAAVDHFGFPNSDIIQWDECWDDPAFSLINVAGVHDGIRWEVTTDGSGSGGGNVTSHVPQYTTADNNNFRLLGLGSIPAGGHVDIQLRGSHVTAVFTDDVTARLDWRFLLPPTARANITFIMGFTSGFQPSNGITDGTFLYLAPSDTNWQFKSISGGTPSAPVDTGVAAGSGLLHRASITLVGGNQADDTAPRAIAIIDDVNVANVTSRLPYTAPGAGSGRPLSPIFGVNSAATSSVIDLLVGPVRYRQSI